jgi:alkylated DNA repair dioxygenase AlkB
LLTPLRERAAAIAGVPATSLQQVLLTEYAPGAAVGSHRDKPMFEDVIAPSFLAPSRPVAAGLGARDRTRGCASRETFRNLIAEAP